MNRPMGYILRLLVGSLIWIVLLVASIETAELFAPDGFVLPIAIALALGELWAAVLIHELGHAVAAYFIGWRTHMIGVWPVAYLPRLKRFTLNAVVWKRSPQGFVLATPPVGHDWQRGWILYGLGGVSANLLTGAVAAAIFAVHVLGPPGHAIAGSFALLSALMVFGNLVPIWGPDLQRNDGARLIDRLRGCEEAVSESLLWLLAAQLDGVPSRDWSPVLVRRVETEEFNSRSIAELAYTLLLSYYLANSDAGRARDAVEELASLHETVPDWIKIHQAFFLIYIDGNALLLDDSWLRSDAGTSTGTGARLP